MGKMLAIVPVLFWVFYLPMKVGAAGGGVHWAVAWAAVTAVVLLFMRRLGYHSNGFVKNLFVGCCVMVPAYYIGNWVWG